jgi:hypothetical protein
MHAVRMSEVEMLQAKYESRHYNASGTTFVSVF